MNIQIHNQTISTLRPSPSNPWKHSARCFLRHSAAAFLLLVLGLLLLSSTAPAEENAEIDLTSGFAMQVHQFPAGNDNLLIWLPSKYGLRDGHTDFASKIQHEGIDCWLVDLHESYLAPTGRYAYAQFEPKHVKELIDHAVQHGWQNIILGGESRGAALAMQAARRWQIENPGNAALKGLLFFHPYLIDGQTEIGEKASFLPIARATNLPVYLFQPQHSVKRLHSEELIEQLRIGGAPVYFHPVPDVRGGFYARDPDRLNPREQEERRQVGQRIRMAVDLLVRSSTPNQAAAQASNTAPEKVRDIGSEDTLIALNAEDPPPLHLPNENDQLIDLKDQKGEVVLVNFWASWCGPCVKEIASLVRLIERFEGRPFRVLTVNIGESKAQVRDFFDRLDITPNFDVLFDPDGEAAKQWRVYAIPSNYLLDKELQIRFGYRGALKWDKPSVIEIVQGLVE